MEEVKDKVVALLNKINRPGMAELMDFLEKSDYYEAPASTKYHGAYKKGLVEHSYKVYEILKGKIEYHKLEVSEDTLAIITLLHDLCKVNFYKVDYRNAKNAKGEWEKVPYYTIDDTIPYGHGEKSVMMITEYIKLTNEEKYAIRWHMGEFGDKNSNTISQAYDKYPLAVKLHLADLESTFLREKGTSQVNNR